jgi:hypothetical protein
MVAPAPLVPKQPWEYAAEMLIDEADLGIREETAKSVCQKLGVGSHIEPTVAHWIEQTRAMTLSDRDGYRQMFANARQTWAIHTLRRDLKLVHDTLYADPGALPAYIRAAESLIAAGLGLPYVTVCSFCYNRWKRIGDDVEDNVQIYIQKRLTPQEERPKRAPRKGGTTSRATISKPPASIETALDSSLHEFDSFTEQAKAGPAPIEGAGYHYRGLVNIWIDELRKIHGTTRNPDGTRGYRFSYTPLEDQLLSHAGKSGHIPEQEFIATRQLTPELLEIRGQLIETVLRATYEGYDGQQTPYVPPCGRFALRCILARFLVLNRFGAPLNLALHIDDYKRQVTSARPELWTAPKPRRKSEPIAIDDDKLVDRINGLLLGLHVRDELPDLQAQESSTLSHFFRMLDARDKVRALLTWLKSKDQKGDLRRRRYDFIDQLGRLHPEVYAPIESWVGFGDSTGPIAREQARKPSIVHAARWLFGPISEFNDYTDLFAEGSDR